MNENKQQLNIKNIKRRNFVKAFATGSLGAAVLGHSFTTYASSTSKKENGVKKKVLIKVGCQTGGTTKGNLEFKARNGVFNIDGRAPKYIKGVGWNMEDSLAKKEACEKYGISLDAYHFPLSSDGIDKVEFPNIMLGKSPERDREIEILQQMISVAGKTGVHCLNYNTTILPVLRTGKILDPNRGKHIIMHGIMKRLLKKMNH